MTQYEKWEAGLIGNFGSFQTTLFNAYRLADNGNREKLGAAFPNWFKPTHTQMCDTLRDSGMFVGGLTDEQIEGYYNRSYSHQ